MSYRPNVLASMRKSTFDIAKINKLYIYNIEYLLCIFQFFSHTSSHDFYVHYMEISESYSDSIDAVCMCEWPGIMNAVCRRYFIILVCSVIVFILYWTRSKHTVSDANSIDQVSLSVCLSVSLSVCLSVSITHRHRCRRHRVASSSRRVAPPWPRRMVCLSPDVSRNRSSVVAELVCPARAKTTMPRDDRC